MITKLNPMDTRLVPLIDKLNEIIDWVNEQQNHQKQELEEFYEDEETVSNDVQS